MKKLISFFIMFSFSVGASAQNISKYDTCHNLRQYEGEWKYVDGLDTIKIYLRYYKYISKIGLYDSTYTMSDDLIGWHEYKVGNTVIESNYQNRFMILPYNFDTYPWNANSTDFSILLSIPNCNDNYFELQGLIDDYHKPQKWGGHDVIAKLNATRTVMTWRQRLHEGLINPPYTTMTLPYTFVLIKQ